MMQTTQGVTEHAFVVSVPSATKNASDGLPVELHRRRATDMNCVDRNGGTSGTPAFQYQHDEKRGM